MATLAVKRVYYQNFCPSTIHTTLHYKQTSQQIKYCSQNKTPQRYTTCNCYVTVMVRLHPDYIHPNLHFEIETKET
jgi:hypothetical protein